MATPKPQVRSAFATPVLVHFLPVAHEANAELRPLIFDRMKEAGGSGSSWRSANDFESWGGLHAETLCRVLRELADSATSTRGGGRVSLPWKISTCACVAGNGAARPVSRRPDTF